MSVFKKKVYFPQFVAELITSQFGFLERNFANLIVLADESEVLTDSQKREFFDKTRELIIADIMMACQKYLCGRISNEEIGAVVGAVYGRYLTEYKRIAQTTAQQETNKVSEFLDLICRVEDEAKERHEHHEKIGYAQLHRIDNDIDKARLHLCQAFSKYCAGGNARSENREGSAFAAFKLATAFVQGDVVGHALEHCSVSFR